MDSGATRVSVTADVSLSGVLGQFASSSVVTQIASRLADGFAGNNSTRLTADSMQRLPVTTGKAPLNVSPAFADLWRVFLNRVRRALRLAERRVAFLIDSSLSGLPAFLTADPGLSSGFMSLQIVAAALVSENRQRSHPASGDSVPTVGNQEDIVSMATHGARRLLDMAKNTGAIVAIELLAAVEGMDCRQGLRSNPRLVAVRSLVRAEIPAMARDREFSPAIESAVEMVRLGRVATAVGRDGVPVL